MIFMRHGNDLRFRIDMQLVVNIGNMFANGERTDLSDFRNAFRIISVHHVHENFTLTFRQ